MELQQGFNFNPEIDPELTGMNYVNELSEKRSLFLNELVAIDEESVIQKMNEEELFTDQSFDYFNDKANEIWNIVDVKYSDYFHPDLASHLINLHSNLKDLCAHIRQYNKSRRFAGKSSTYRDLGRRGAAVSIVKVVELTNILKKEGFSEAAALVLSENEPD